MNKENFVLIGLERGKLSWGRSPKEAGNINIILLNLYDFHFLFVLNIVGTASFIVLQVAIPKILFLFLVIEIHILGSEIHGYDLSRGSVCKYLETNFLAYSFELTASLGLQLRVVHSLTSSKFYILLISPYYKQTHA